MNKEFPHLNEINTEIYKKAAFIFKSGMEKGREELKNASTLEVENSSIQQDNTSVPAT